MGGKQIMAVAPKDGHLYGFDLATNKLLYRVPVTTIENAEGTFAVGKDVHFCPGAGGRRRMEHARPTIRPRISSSPVRSTGAIPSRSRMTADFDRCRRAAMDRNGDVQPVQHVRQGRPIRRTLGRMDLCHRRRHRRLEMARQVQLPDLGAITPTAGGVVFFGDLGGNFYAFDSANGQKLWGVRRSAARSAAA